MLVLLLSPLTKTAAQLNSQNSKQSSFKINLKQIKVTHMEEDLVIHVRIPQAFVLHAGILNPHGNKLLHWGGGEKNASFKYFYGLYFCRPKRWNPRCATTAILTKKTLRKTNKINVGHYFDTWFLKMHVVDLLHVGPINRWIRTGDLHLRGSWSLAQRCWRADRD